MMIRKLIVLLFVVLFSLAGAFPVFAQSTAAPAPGAVYVMTNATTGNQVLAYHRAGDGSLTFLGGFATGGLGSGVGVTVPPDPLGSQHSLIVSKNGKWVFAVNAGSNEISALKVTASGLQLAGKISSGGSYPVSLALYDDTLYVLNAAGDGNVTAFTFEDGIFTPIKNSTRSLNAATPANGAQPQILESPAQVGFSPDGSYLVVTDKGGVSGKGRILVFKLTDELIAAALPVITITSAPVPFSFVFDPFGHLVVVDPSATSITAYAISGQGALTTLSSVMNHQPAICWIVSNGTYLFSDNTGAGTVSALQSNASGSLTILNAAAGITGAGTLPLDVAISADGQYLYSLEVGAGAIGIFHINANGSLTAMGAMGGLPALAGYQGIAAY